MMLLLLLRRMKPLRRLLVAHLFSSAMAIAARLISSSCSASLVPRAAHLLLQPRLPRPI
jgi:hypothetical protein